MRVKYSQDKFVSYDMVNRYARDNGYGLTIYVNFIIKCVCYMGFGSNGCFMAGAALTDSHYKTNIISGIGHPRSDSVMPLVLCIVTYNIRGTNVVLKVPRNNANLAENG
jgi:hypothetical protein